jgi:Dyp-type peroxidase family
MPINLNAALSWKNATPDEQQMLQALQGNILKGHGRKFTANIFFKLDPAKSLESKRLLRELANHHLTNAHQQLLDTERLQTTGVGGSAFAHLALSAKGYVALGMAAGAPTDADFQAGMKSAASIAALTDPAIANWEAPFQQDLHGVLLAADETESKTAALAHTLEELIVDAGGVIVHVQHGKALLNAAGVGIENFGYVDGRSQPLMLQEDIDEESQKAGRLRWDPGFTLGAALVKDPGTADPNSFGSFFVFRKLEQDVRGFKTREQQVADVLGLTGDDRELAGAMIVGRFEDGTPVTLSKTARGKAPPNDFDYSGDAGKRCPFHAHIRKSNPRGSGGAEPEAAERGHLMPRRGIPYEDVKRAFHPDEVQEAETLAEFMTKVAPLLPTGGVGLLFMAYNSLIAKQFKFTQQIWVNNTNFPLVPAGSHGIDPVIGQGAANPNHQKLPKDWDNPAAGNANNVSFAGFVKMKGGEYFFSPSLTFLKDL